MIQLQIDVITDASCQSMTRMNPWSLDATSYNTLSLARPLVFLSYINVCIRQDEPQSRSRSHAMLFGPCCNTCNRRVILERCLDGTTGGRVICVITQARSRWLALQRAKADCLTTIQTIQDPAMTSVKFRRVRAVLYAMWACTVVYFMPWASRLDQ